MAQQEMDCQLGHIGASWHRLPALLHYMATVGFEVTVVMLWVYVYCAEPKRDLESSTAWFWKTKQQRLTLTLIPR